MRTSEQIYHQLRWDPRFEAADYHLGVARRHGPVKEMPLLSFQPGGDVPWHRILYVRGPQGIVWDRRDGRDELTPPEKTRLGGLPLRLVTWNLAAGRHGLPLEPRLRPMLDFLQPWPAEVVALQEAGDDFCAHLEAAPYLYRSGELLLYLRHPPRDLREIELSEGKTALLAELADLRLAVVHLTSDYHGPAHKRRWQQWQALRPHLGEGPWLVVGDLNASDDELKTWGDDITPPDFSFDPARNPYARATSRSGRAARYQRLLVNGLEGEGQVRRLGLSDHEPLEFKLRAAEPCSHRSALAVLPPRSLWPRIDELRKLHDPAYGRWMPHLNLLYPAPLAPDYDRLRLALADQPRFSLRLDGWRRFPQGTVYWCPESAEELRQLRFRLGGRGPFTPHLTLGKGRFDPEGSWRAEFEVTHVVHLRREEEGPFEIAQALPLRPHHPLYQEIRGWCPVPPLVVGSACFETGADLDLVVPATLSELTGARRVERVWRGDGFDLAEAEPDRFDHHWQSVLDRDALWTWLAQQGRLEGFGGELSQLYDWLAERGLKGQAWGWPGGLAWTVMLAAWGWQDFPGQLARWNWSVGVGLDDRRGSPRPMTVWSPAKPSSNLTSHVPPELLEQLLLTPRGRILRIAGDPEGLGLGLVMDLIRQRGLTVRPFVTPHHCDLYLQGDLAEVLEYARVRLPPAVRLSWVQE